MLTRLQLKNFKGWEETPGIRLAPLTVFFGSNSSGKTSLLQSILLLKQTAESSDRSRVLHTGDRRALVDLGTGSDIVFGHDPSRKIGIDITWRLPSPLELPRSRPTELRFLLDVGLGGEGQPYVHLARYMTDEVRVDLELREDAQGYDLKSEPPLKRQKGRPWPLPAPVRFYGFPDEVWNYFQKASWLADLALALEHQLARVQYLGPLRLKPERSYVWSGERPSSVGTSGEDAVAALLAAEAEGRKVARGVGKGRRYEPLSATVARSLKEMGVIDSFRVERINKNRKEFEVRVQRTPRSAEVLITDVGVGVSQMLPVLVQCYYARRGATVIFEQPEIHLHPRVQADLADVFVDASLNGTVQFIIESHSEHFLRRLQRRVAEEQIGKDHVAFYVCDASEGSSRITELQVDEVGAISNWPKDFFGDEMGDLTAMTQAAMRRRKRK